jgi:hypothetical protein
MFIELGLELVEPPIGEEKPPSSFVGKEPVLSSPSFLEKEVLRRIHPLLEIK